MKTSKLGALVLSTAALLSGISGCEVCVGMRGTQQGCYQAAPFVGYQSPCSSGCYMPSDGCGSMLPATPTPMQSAPITPNN
ncbi:MAG: hypothetical protein PHF67_01720 [Candidatus Nanoarchaeia archaeon]|nr:hypothetical protein [Candidatus Nanoarchaeia archaeon]